MKRLILLLMMMMVVVVEIESFLGRTLVCRIRRDFSRNRSHQRSSLRCSID